ncbi:substrate-binding periplasmic protein [Pseudodesulfovibrio sediminis]|nr:transporter substrate-binding domain-containing protein [Pseudodesulfovibrio sediminis]
MAQEVVVAVDHFPPWKIIDEEKISGIDIELVQALLAEVGMTPKLFPCPWSRALSMMKTGQADMISGILKRPEREKTMIFIAPPYKTKSRKAFYIRTGTRDIVSYEDLSNLTIGVQHDAIYFDRFDTDQSLRKAPVHEDKLNFKMLAAGRVDTVIITESIGDYLVADLGLNSRITKATYCHDKAVPVYFAVSRKSPLAARVKELSEAAQRLSESGVFDRIIADYFTQLKTDQPPSQ